MQITRALIVIPDTRFQMVILLAVSQECLDFILDKFRYTCIYEDCQKFESLLYLHLMLKFTHVIGITVSQLSSFRVLIVANAVEYL